MPSRNTIEIIINAKDNASQIISDIGKNTSQIGMVATGAIVAGVGAASAAITGLAVKGVQEFMKFEQGMQEVFSLLPGISQDAMDKMTNQVERLSQIYGVLPEKTIPAMYEALSAGIPQDNLYEFLDVANKAAIGGVTELATAVDGISSVMNAYGADVIDASKASDLMFQAVKFGKTTFDQLSASLYNVTPTAAALGVPFEDIAAQLAAITAQGVPTSVATTQMRDLLNQLSKAGTKTADMFTELAGKSFRDFIAEGNTVQDALQLLEAEAKKSGLSISDMFTSVEAANAALALTGKGTERYTQFLAEMANAAGSTDQAFETMAKSLQFQVNRLNAKFSVFLKTIGEKLAPTIAIVVKAFGDALSIIIDVVDGIEDFTDAIQESNPTIKKFLQLVLSLSLRFRTYFRILKDTSEAILAGVNPFEAFITVLRNYINVQDSTINVLVGFFNAIEDVVGIVKTLTRPITDWIRDNVKLQDILIALGVAVASFVIPAIIGLATTLAPIIATFGLLVVGATLLRKAWQKNFLGIRDIVSKVADFIGTKLTDIRAELNINRIFSKLNGGTGFTFLDNLIKNFERVKEAVAPLFNAIKEAVSKIDFGQLFEIGKTLLTLTSPLGIIKTLFETTFQVSIFDLFIEGINKVTYFIEKLSSGASIYEALGIKQESEIGQFITNIINFFKEAVNFVQTKVIPALQAFGNWFLTEALPAIVNFVVNTALPAINRFFGWLGETWEKVRPALESIANWFLNEALPSVVNFVTNTVIPRINDLVRIISDIWNAVSPSLTELARWFINDALPQIVNFINNTVIPVIQDITTIISEIWTLVQPTLQLLYDWFVTTGLPAISNFIKDVVIVQIQNFIDIVKGIWEFVAPGVRSLRDNLRSIFGWIGTNIIDPLLNRVRELRDTLINLGLIQGQTSTQIAQGMVNSKLNNMAYEASKFGYGSGSINSYGGFGGFANGLPYVPRDSIVKVHQGERILTADENENYGKGGNTYNTITLSVPNVTSQSEADKQTRFYVNALRNSGVDI